MIRTAFFALMLCAATAAQADPIVRLDNPAAVAHALREEGFRAKLGADSKDRPRIATGVRGVKFSITFYGCKKQVDCYGLLFSTWFDLNNGIALAPINEWNADSLLGRAFVDAECNPVIDHYIFADRKRSISHFAEEIEHWGDVISDFADFVFEIDDEATGVASCAGDDVL